MPDDRPDGVYVVEPIEYIRSRALPDIPTLQNPEQVQSLLRDTRDSIRSCSPDNLTRLINEVFQDQEETGRVHH
ncbi:hypothetical protein [Sphaerisporangium perillae]|uniref:hypothetical protein n=1 Tax=Sphaerisporangium perillae TaxID=2935860 RepID=UPI00200E55F2|nr:hypothetical protein [Sphaerisporangium perillae]